MDQPKTRSAFSDNWQDIVRNRVILFGGSTLFLTLLAGAFYLLGKGGGETFAATLLFFLPNITISKIAGRSRSPSRVEHFRLIVNAILLPLVYHLAGDGFGPFWWPYSIMSLSVSTTRYLFTEKRLNCYLEIFFWACHFTFFSWLYAKFTGPSGFLVALTGIVIPGVYLTQLMHLLRQSLLREKANGAALSEAQSKLERAGRLSALGEMAGGIAHEINNPLAIIKCGSDALTELAQGEEFDRADLIRFAASISRTTDRIASIVGGLRMFSRDGSLDEFQTVSIGQLVEQTLGFCRERFRTHGVNVEVGASPLDLTFEGKAASVSQILLNLLNNSFDALEAAPEKWVRIEISETTDACEIRVVDGGKGIPLQLQEKIFNPFYTTKEIGRGTGLGLSVSLGIARAHGGTLRLETGRPNTCFVLTLPKKQPVGTVAAA